MRTASKMAVAITTIALAVGLSACSGGQSVADACKVINTEGQKIISDSNSAMGDVASDPSAAAKTLKSISGQMKDLGKKVTNADVKKAWDGLVTSYDGFSELIDTVAGDPSILTDQDKAADFSTKVQDSAKTLTEKGNALDKLCK
ncbi:hypothetical protein [Microbacterium sp.]|uniref:hypothetical protein n=1 Tax=Microbacterium sp. TaxID=51671 RepID=UPI003A8DEEE3